MASSRASTSASPANRSRTEAASSAKTRAAAPYDHFAGTQPQFPLHTGKQRHDQRHQRDGGQQVEDIGARSDPGEQAKY